MYKDVKIGIYFASQTFRYNCRPCILIVGKNVKAPVDKNLDQILYIYALQ
jgi:hypothetical protein